MESLKGRHALVMGASGITGWAIVNQLLRGYPRKGIFSKVTAVTNRPLSPQGTLWPQSDSLRLVSGLDLASGSQEDLQSKMKCKIKDIENVTDVYFYGEQNMPSLFSTLTDGSYKRIAIPTTPKSKVRSILECWKGR